MAPIIICMTVKPGGPNQVNSYYTECCANKSLSEVNRTQSYDFSCTFNLRKYATKENNKGQDKESEGHTTPGQLIHFVLNSLIFRSFLGHSLGPSYPKCLQSL